MAEPVAAPPAPPSAVVPVATPPAPAPALAPAAAPPSPAQPAAPTPAAAAAPAPVETPAPPAGPQRGPDGKFVPKATEPDPSSWAADWKPKLPEKLPEGVKLDDTLVTAAKNIMADAKTTPADKLQALVDLQLGARTNEIKAMQEMMQRQRVADLDTIKGDPEFGGAKFDATVKGSKSILSSLKYGPAVSKKLELYGLDCDPDFTRMLAEVRSLIAEDSTATRLTNTSTSVPQRPMSQTERQARTYENTRQKQGR